MKAILVLVTFCVTLAALLALPQPSAQAVGALRVTSTPVIVATADPNATPIPPYTPDAYPYPAPQAERPAVAPAPAPRHARPAPRCRGPLAALACGVVE